MGQSGFGRGERVRHHGSLAPTHEGRDKGAATGRSPNFAECAWNEVPLQRKDPLNYRTVVI